MILFRALAVLAAGAVFAFEYGAAPAPGAASGAAPDAGARHYIDFDRGDDSADGRSLATAWRHAPGDAAAQGRPARTQLRGGDVLLFAPGVRYRGQIRLNGGGAPGAPVVLTSAPGASPAVIDGSDPAPAGRPCRSAEDCGGAGNWAKLTRIDFAEPLETNAVLFSNAGLLYPAQAPGPKDLFNSDEVSEFVVADGHDLEQGLARLPAELARKVAGPGEKRLVLELYGNLLETRDISSLNGTEAHFDPSGLKFNTARPAHFAVVMHPSLVSRPGEYGLLEGKRSVVVFLPPEARQVFVAHGRQGIDVNRQSFVTIKGLAFENMADNGPGSNSGVGVVKGAAGSDLAIEDNRFRHFRLAKGAGPIAVNFTQNLTISRNEIYDIAFGSGMRLYKSGNVLIEGNGISRIGRTGIMSIGLDGLMIRHNRIGDARGIHGNGISVYLVNHGVKVVANTITDAIRPVTFEGTADGENDILFANNLFVGTPESDAALTSWGQNTRIVIAGNVLIGGKQGLALSATDKALTIDRNVMNGKVVVKHSPYMAPGAPGYVPPAWTVSANRQVDYQVGDKLSFSPLQRQVADALAAKPAGAWTGLCGLLAPPDEAGGTVAIGAALECPVRQAQR